MRRPKRRALRVEDGYATGVSFDVPELGVYMESLRRAGFIYEQFDSREQADGWRAAMRRACRAEPFRVRTFIRPEHAEGADTGRVLVYIANMDREVTLEEGRAAVSAPPAPEWCGSRCHSASV